MHTGAFARSWICLLALTGCQGESGALDMGIDLARAANRDLSVESDLSAHRPDLSVYRRDFATACPEDLAPLDLSVTPHSPAAGAPTFAAMVKGPAPVVNAMQAWTVVWQGDEQIGVAVDQFLKWMLTSDYWQLLAQYGVGSGASHGVIVLPPSVPVDDLAAINAAVSRGGIPIADANTALFIVPPKTVNCFQGPFHDFQTVAYVHLDQTHCTVGLAPYTFDDLTFYLSHEAAELATDPKPQAHSGWSLPPGIVSNEIGDLCRGGNSASPPLTVTTGADGGVGSYTVTRLYSNAAAAQGTTYPCGPDPLPLPRFGISSDSRNQVSLAPLVSGCSIPGERATRLVPFSVEGDSSLHWDLAADDPIHCQVVPASGDALPGTDFFVFPSSFQVGICSYTGLVSAPSHPGSTQPFYWETIFSTGP